jgi:sodium-coupled neutral amino acid transporter 7/8
MFTSLALALFIPEIKKIISPLGSLAAVFIFVLPGLCLLKLSLQSHFRGKFCNFLAAVISCIFVCFGCFILGDDLTHNIMDDIVGD